MGYDILHETLGDIRKPIPGNGGEWLEKYGPSWQEDLAQASARWGASLLHVAWPGKDATDVPILEVTLKDVYGLLQWLKEDLGYAFLADITATDETSEGAAPTFFVVYQLRHTATFRRLRVKVKVLETQPVPTVVTLWLGANWAEREVFDMFGIVFEGHPDLRRILMDARWEGHPLRKSYPLRGYQIFTEPQVVDPSLLE